MKALIRARSPWSALLARRDLRLAAGVGMVGDGYKIAWTAAAGRDCWT
jgi:hypothetical protein